MNDNVAHITDLISSIIVYLNLLCELLFMSRVSARCQTTLEKRGLIMEVYSYLSSSLLAFQASGAIQTTLTVSFTLKQLCQFVTMDSFAVVSLSPTTMTSSETSVGQETPIEYDSGGGSTSYCVVA
jgi:hypothetical protein